MNQYGTGEKSEPVISRATIICVTVYEHACMSAPTDMMTTPVKKVFFRPRCSPALRWVSSSGPLKICFERTNNHRRERAEQAMHPY